MKQPLLAGNPTTVISLGEILGPHGESSISYQYDGSRLRVEIEFDFEDQNSAPSSRKVTIVFKGVVDLHIASVPGVDVLNFGAAEKHAKLTYDLDDVIEYRTSEAASAWSAHFGWTIRHFHVYFTHENQRLDVFAKDCGVES